MRKRIRKITVGFVVCGLLAFGVTGPVAMPVCAEETATIKPNVEYHSMEDIKAYFEDHELSSQAVQYAVKPKVTAPYSLGSLTESTKNTYLSYLNAVRYVAGLNDDVTWNDYYGERAQAGALADAANRTLSHFPGKPSGMDDALYAKCSEGAGHSNIWCGWSSSSYRFSVGSMVVNSWMADDDSSNISRVGHRRWFLSPTMQETGFGAAVDSTGNAEYSAAWVMDLGRSGSESYITWPAQEMPVEMFDANYPWSISAGESIDGSAVAVRLTRKSDGRVWKFGKTGSNGNFYVDGGGYGQSGDCIIFRPSGLSIAKGDAFSVQVTGLPDGKELDYDVNFFSMYPDPPAVEMYRLYHALTKEHFYTSSTHERDVLVTRGWKYEGIGWYAPEKSKTPVYRLYNPVLKDHHYTTSTQERDVLSSKYGWKYEGIGWYSDDAKTVPLYRRYYPYITSGSHHYTTSQVEARHLVKVGWRDEGIAWYGVEKK
uniref:CAP domain-containing protein n=1 Tax=Eubacterium cellulosolvens TaxID=29322 RepID=UPI000A581183|nr:CAP domain-containing protein [[Eubacterium] cellulosolvens]